VTGTHRLLRWFKSLWLSAWPLWTFAVFAGLAAVRLLPVGYTRTTLAAPILLLVPGSLTLGAVFSQRNRPRGVAFACYAALLSAVWSAFASLALYARDVPITADSTYWYLLMVSAVLTTVAEARLLLGRPGGGRRAARRLETLDLDPSDAAANGIEKPTEVRGAGYYVIVAVVAGISLLAAGLYAYDHLPHPAPTGYTQMAWTGPPIKGDIAVSSTGAKLRFEIVHRQSDTTTFRLSAAWLGTTSRPLAKPMSLSIGPNQTFRGSLLIPTLPDGCTYRIVVVLTATRQIDPLTKEPQTWSINANVHDPRKSPKMCKR